MKRNITLAMLLALLLGLSAAPLVAQMTGIKGEQVLYIGDHIYGDILRLRKQHMWRTAMVLQ